MQESTDSQTKAKTIANKIQNQLRILLSEHQNYTSSGIQTTNCNNIGSEINQQIYFNAQVTPICIGYGGYHQSTNVVSGMYVLSFDLDVLN